MRRIFSAALALMLSILFALALVGCGSGGTNSFTWRVDELPGNLDPQIATTSSDVMACIQLYSGLFRMGTDGTPQNEVCESYSLSADSLTYTFNLKKGLTYNGYRGAANDTPVTANDFVFGLYRVFLPETGSPYVEQLSNIVGCDAVRSGSDRSALGVKALDEYTLQITLKRPDPDFLTRLCLPGAMPCNEAFFTASAGAYALTVKMVLGNGSFYLYNWTESGLFLRRRSVNSLVDAVRIVLATGDTSSAETVPDPVSLVSTGKSDAALYDGEYGTGLTEISYTTTTWCLLFNCENSNLANTSIRRALAAEAYDTALELPEMYSTAVGLVPPEIALGAGSYRNTVGNVLPGIAGARDLYRAGLGELGVSSLRGVTVLVPDGSDIASLFDYVNQNWQAELSLYCNVERAPLTDVISRVDAGDYTIALLPLSAQANDPLETLSRFTAGGLCGWGGDGFTSGVRTLQARLPLLASSASEVALLERQLLESAAVAPLFCQTKLLLLSPNVSGIVFNPFANTIDLTYATKK